MRIKWSIPDFVALRHEPGVAADVDRCSFEPERLMFYPRHDKGAPFEAQAGGAEFMQLAELVPDAVAADELARLETLQAYDLYYYDRAEHTMTGGGEKPLPVLRAVFDDAHGTWVHIDPATGAVLGRLDSHRRASRWRFGMLHRRRVARLPSLAIDGLTLLRIPCRLVGRLTPRRANARRRNAGHVGG